MCMSAPKIPPPPPPPQAAKEPDSMADRRRSRQQMGFGSGTMLTGAQGIKPGLLNTGSNTLLGS